ncbi:MAG: Rrf2 family transcriptional regulator [Candidatus Tectomicrobia bacterium]|nr:Rrf2 family transcriptional regulator [Candidatus Tectomicrobia bacterium]
MQLTAYTDYALRVLIYLAVHEERLVTIAEMATAYGISKNHLMKIVHQLGQGGCIETLRGRGGGLRLAHPPDRLYLGEIVRKTEPHFHVVECFHSPTNRCPITPACGLAGALGEARDAFLAVLDRYTLADIIQEKQALAQLLKLQ